MTAHATRLVLGSYPFHLDIPIRLADLDHQRHVNNVRVGEFYQDARVALFRPIVDQHGAPREHGRRIVVAHHAMDFLAELSFPGVVTVGVGVGKLGRSSVEFGCGLFQDGRCAGLAKTVVVHMTREGPAVLPDPLRAALQTLRLAGG
jgi:acyl-CoA thioester hydrolase